ncbi:MAG: SLC13 family permease, partial [Cyanobacteria bacterium J06641_5]
PIGSLLLIFGVAYLAAIAPILLGERRPPPDLTSSYGLDDFVSEVVIMPDSQLVGQTLRSSQLQRQFDLDVLEIIRQGTRFSQPIADKSLQLGDILLVRGSRDEVLKIRQEQGLDLVPDVKFSSVSTALSTAEEGVAEVLILSNSRLVGSTLKDLRFRQRYNSTVLALRRGQELVRSRLGQVPLRFGDLLLVQGPQQSLLGLQTSRELLVLNQSEADAYRQGKAFIALAIASVAIVASALKFVPILPAMLAGALLMVATGCLKPGEVYGAVRWDTIFLLAGFIPLGIAMENSGATTWLSNHLSGLAVSGYWVLVTFYGLTALLSAILSNNAVVVVMIPVAVEVARNIGLDPLAAILAVTFAASSSFMTPIGYQTNAMIYGAGGYRFSDFLRIGTPLTLALTLIAPWLILTFHGS